MADRLKKKPATRRDRDDARRLQRAGTHGDTVLAHINPQERDLLDLLADGLLDGGGRNPTTGLLSFGMSDGEAGGFGGSSGTDSNPGGVGGGPAGGNTGGGIGGNTDGGQGGRDGGYGGLGYSGSRNQKAAEALGDYYRDTYIHGMLDNPYAPKDTWQRVWQEYWNPSIAPPGRYSPPTATHPGIFGSFISQITPTLSVGPVGVNAFGIGMNIGGAMGRASSPATQAANAAAESARSGVNSGGNQGSHSVQAMDAKIAAMGGAAPAGTASGAQTAEQLGAVPGLTTAPGYTVNEAGQVVPTGGGRNQSGLPTPVKNLLLDYLWRGRQGSGWGW